MISLARREAMRILRDDIDEMTRRLDLHLGRLVTAESDGTASIALDEALEAAHAIADRLEAFAYPRLPPELPEKRKRRSR
jgi:hypothetical protein